MSNNQNIPKGLYQCIALPDEDDENLEGPVRMPIKADNEGYGRVKIRVGLMQRGSDEVTYVYEDYQTIDPEAPAKGEGNEKTPAEFALDAFMALGATSREQTIDAMQAGMESADQILIVPGLGDPARRGNCEIKHKASTRPGGGTFVNIQYTRMISEESRAKAKSSFDRLRRPSGGSSPAPVAPPAFSAPVPFSPPRPAARSAPQAPVQRDTAPATQEDPFPYGANTSQLANAAQESAEQEQETATIEPAGSSGNASAPSEPTLTAAEKKKRDREAAKRVAQTGETSRG